MTCENIDRAIDNRLYTVLPIATYIYITKKTLWHGLRITTHMIKSGLSPDILSYIHHMHTLEEELPNNC